MTGTDPAPPTALGLLLAGGASRRMGRPKRMLDLGGRSLLERGIETLAAVAERVLILVEPGGAAAALPGTEASDVTVREDRIAHAGPLAALAGVATGLPHGWIPVLAVDQPGVTPTLLGRILALARRSDPEIRVVLPAWEDRIEPLAALYHSTALERLSDETRRGATGLLRALDTLGPGVLRCGPRSLGITPEAWDTVFRNLNRPEDLTGPEEPPP